MSERFRLARHCNEEGYKLLYDSIAKSMSEPPNPIMIGKIGANELLVIYQAIGILQNQIADFSLVAPLGLGPYVNHHFLYLLIQ